MNSLPQSRYHVRGVMLPVVVLFLLTSVTAQTTERYEREGVAVDFNVEPISSGTPSELREGLPARVQFKITDNGKPLTNLRPSAWIALRKNTVTPDAKECREKVTSFLQGNLSNRPDLNLNSYFILALNQEPNISVLDPFAGFGTLKLQKLIVLASPGEGWVLSRDSKQLYVSMPLVNQVAVIDTENWKVTTQVDAGIKPTSLVLQHDEKYLWVGNDSPDAAVSGITVIDTKSLKVAARINTGTGPHRIALTDDDRYAFITNKQSGTLSIVDVARLARLKDVKVAPLPTALAFSSLSRTVYVASEGDGTITAVNASSHGVITKMTTQPGLHALRLLPSDRLLAAVNRANSTVYFFDVSTNRIVQTIPVEPKPDEIAFTADFAYVRSVGSEFVTMIKLSELGNKSSQPAISRFPGGQKKPEESLFSSVSPSIVPAPEAGAVLVANPADKMIYYYMEGMAAPMGNFQNYKRDPRAILIVDNSLRETSPGTYTTKVTFNGHGQYDVAFLLDSPRIVNCFQLAVKENPALPSAGRAPIRVEMVSSDSILRPGESYQLRLKVIDSITNQPKADLTDLGVLVFLAPGVWQQRALAKPLGDGIYEISFVPPDAGIYNVFFQSPSLGVQYKHLPNLVLKAIKP